MLTQEERRLIPLVSRGGCVNITALRQALLITKAAKTSPATFPKLFIYHYLKETDKDGDEPMLNYDECTWQH
jgi:hypothetical protein